MELAERDRQFEVRIALPGYEPHDLELTATPHELLVHGRLRTEHKEKGGQVRWSQFRSHDVYRRIELPETIDLGHVKATLKHGILKIIAPKKVLSAPGKATADVPVAA